MEKGLSLDTLFSKPNSQALVLCFLFVEKKIQLYIICIGGMCVYMP